MRVGAGSMTIREKVARAICTECDPDMCVNGSVGTGDTPSVCYQRAWELHVGQATAAINAFLAAAAEDGWHMRPDSVTEDMLNAWAKAPGRINQAVYRAMLAAAPEFEWDK